MQCVESVERLKEYEYFFHALHAGCPWQQNLVNVTTRTLFIHIKARLFLPDSLENVFQSPRNTVSHLVYRFLRAGHTDHQPRSVGRAGNLRHAGDLNLPHRLIETCYL